SSEDIQQLIDELVLEKDKEIFESMLIDSLERLHEGNVARSVCLTYFRILLFLPRGGRDGRLSGNPTGFPEIVLHEYK
ncbi:MAG: hypothetical protein D3910_07855, partial [Candidatus Electrothrix sp. ATG2]|nr:hypothetical protein [Candidatus Electrothrix sp. ATG2]